MSELFTFITPSDVIEYLFCPRFTYYLNVLKIDQHEQRRTLVQKGRTLHERKLVTNKDYLRQKIGSIGKELNVYMSSEKLKMVGIADEVLFLADGNAAILDYKYAEWKDKIFSTFRIQQTMYALLAEEMFSKKVEKAYIVYIRSNNHLEELKITDKLKKQTLKIVDDVFRIINYAWYPGASTSKVRCQDCCYRNLCDK